MATITFGGSTIWNDAGSGVGQPLYLEGTRERMVLSQHLPRSRGNYLKDLGMGTAVHYLECEYWFASRQDSSALRTTLEGLQSGLTLRSLAVSGFSSVSNCRLVSARAMGAAKPVLKPGGTVVFWQRWAMVFEQVR